MSRAPELAPLRPLTPKEFSEAIGGLRTPNWVREQCKTGAIPSVKGKRKPPYLIPARALQRFRPPLESLVVA
jgi:hypothetical protein